jgi:LacI family transcriptional regulator
MKMFSDMGATVKVKLIDVARHARVSPTTVSRAIAQPDLVNPDTLARVRASAAKLGYVPDGAARALASGRSMTMGAVIPTLDSAIFARALQAMQTALSRQGYQLLVASHDYSAAAEAEAVRMLMTRGVDGLMLVGAQRPAATWELLESANVAIVLTWCDEPRFSAISVDNARAGRIAAQHLIALGHRRIGVVLGALHFNDRQRARLAGIRAAIEEAGLSLPDWCVSEQPLSLAGGRTGCAQMLALDQPPTAIIGGIDILAIGCVEEIHARGLVVPDDLSVVGIDNLEMSAHLFPALSTVHLPVARIGELAAESLLAQLRSGGTATHVDLPVELVVRRSTARLARAQNELMTRKGN